MPTVLITGANRGIGLALSKEFLNHDWQVLACCRQPDQAEALISLACSNLSIHNLDVGNDCSIEDLAKSLHGTPIDVLLNNAGIAGDEEHNTFGNMNYESWAEVFNINTMAPMKMLEAFIDNVESSEQKHVANISSGLASIAAQEGYMFPYSVSKAALNSTMKSLSVILKDRVRINLFTPGWVQTDMGGSDAPLQVHQSAELLYKNITGIDPTVTGKFISHEGNEYPW